MKQKVRNADFAKMTNTQYEPSCGVLTQKCPFVGKRIGVFFIVRFRRNKQAGFSRFSQNLANVSRETFSFGFFWENVSHETLSYGFRFIIGDAEVVLVRTSE